MQKKHAMSLSENKKCGKLLLGRRFLHVHPLLQLIYPSMHGIASQKIVLQNLICPDAELYRKIYPESVGKSNNCGTFTGNKGYCPKKCV